MKKLVEKLKKGDIGLNVWLKETLYEHIMNLIEDLKKYNELCNDITA
ncbi:MAG: hypothetical protein ACFFE5_14830 [Candidatus Thorarchaeota archaeon]